MPVGSGPSRLTAIPTRRTAGPARHHDGQLELNKGPSGSGCLLPGLAMISRCARPGRPGRHWQPGPGPSPASVFQLEVPSQTRNQPGKVRRSELAPLPVTVAEPGPGHLQVPRPGTPGRAPGRRHCQWQHSVTARTGAGLARPRAGEARASRLATHESCTGTSSFRLCPAAARDSVAT